MAAIYLPAIAEKDYPTFRSLPSHNFPGTYDEWLKLLHSLEIYFRARGDDIFWVGVDADEFAHFCARDGTGHNLHNLYHLVFEKVALKKD